MKWFNINTFNIDEYIRCCYRGYGDCNEIIPGKILAFGGPFDNCIL